MNDDNVPQWTTSETLAGRKADRSAAGWRIIIKFNCVSLRRKISTINNGGSDSAAHCDQSHEVRFAGALALIFGSYFCAHTMEIRRETAKALEIVAPAAPPPASVVRQTGPATTFGDHSAANTGNGNIFNDGVATPPKKSKRNR